MPTPSPTKILIVEDEAVVALDLQEIIEGCGYRVSQIATTADEALAALALDPPDLILLDVRLADGSSGITVARQVQSAGSPPVIFLSAHADDATLARIEALEPAQYLLKPFKERELVIALRLALARSEAERRLRRSERRFATTLRSLSDGVVVVGLDGVVQLLNPAAERILGRPADACVGAPIGALLPALPLGDGGLRKLPGGLLTLERPPDPPRQISLSADRLIDEDGSHLGSVLVMQDLTEQIAAAEHRHQLEQRLQKARRLESMGMMAAGVAHDFNNLLTTILGYIELARVETSAEARQLLDLAMRGVVEAAALTRQMLTYVGRGHMNQQLVDLNPLVSRMAELVQVSLGKGVTLSCELAERPITSVVDETQIRQVLANLIVNAQEALEASAGHITLRTGAVELAGPDLEVCLGGRAGPGRYAMITVEDTGIGMSSAMIERIFEPFYSTKFTGRGLGLATVYGIINSHGGALRVESAPGKGTRFSVYLPLEEPGGPGA